LFAWVPKQKQNQQKEEKGGKAQSPSVEDHGGPWGRGSWQSQVPGPLIREQLTGNWELGTAGTTSLLLSCLRGRVGVLRFIQFNLASASSRALVSRHVIKNCLPSSLTSSGGGGGGGELMEAIQRNSEMQTGNRKLGNGREGLPSNGPTKGVAASQRATWLKGL